MKLVDQSVNDTIKQLIENGITEPEDIENCLGVHGVEIRTMYEDSDEHEGYYDTIDEAIEALNEMRKIFPHLSK